MSPDPMDFLPHREPFRFVTRLTNIVPGERGSGVWVVTGSEDFFRGHFPGEPLVPGVLLGEALAQLSGLVGLHGTGHTQGRLIHIDLRLKAPVRPPAEVELSTTLTRKIGPMWQFDVAAKVGGVVAARGSLALAVVDAGAAA